MIRASHAIGAGVAVIGLVSLAQGQWVKFENQTESRLIITTPDLPGDPVGVDTDVEEKDYAWGDVNNDGWIDLVVVRKQPFTSPGKRRNLLLINENGVLVDRTAEYATAADVPGDLGFYTATNDRDVVLVDVNNDGWLDIVTATTISDGDPKHIGHPRVYMNLGEVNGVWRGFRYEADRIPAMRSASGAMGHNPRFCSVAAGDVTGDGYPDLYFGDYDSSGAGGSGQPPGADFDNKLLINLGAENPGYFIDSETSRMSADPMLKSAFGAASVIADINNDGVNDVVKQTSLTSPTHVAVVYNNPNNEGFFNLYHVVNNAAPYFVSVGDLNNDGRLDLIITDDGSDRYMLNQGNDQLGRATFTSSVFSFSYTSPGIGDQGFGSNSIAADLDGDGWNDVIIADVDVDIGGPSGCSRRTQIYRNLGDAPNVTLIEERVGNESTGSVASIPTSMLRGVHDVAVFDINGDGALDLVIGRCTGTQVWINQPQVLFAYPNGRPDTVESGSSVSFNVEVTATANAIVNTEAAKLYVSINDGPFSAYPMSYQGGNVFNALFPPLACGDNVRYYIHAELNGGAAFVDPADAPADWYDLAVIDDLQVVFADDIEGDVSNWTITSHPSVTGGHWEQAFPNGTINSGQLAAPDGDASPNGLGQAFVTENGLPGGSAGASDLDGGPVTLTSPRLDLSQGDGVITYDRWFYCSTASNPSTADFLVTEVSNDDGKSWVLVHSTGGTGGEWERVSFRVSDFVTPTATVRVRFVASDDLNNSVTEAGIDNFNVEVVSCDNATPCPGDVTGNQVVNVDDLLLVISSWGPCAGCDADTDGNGVVNVDDLLTVISGWGVCP